MILKYCQKYQESLPLLVTKLKQEDVNLHISTFLHSPKLMGEKKKKKKKAQDPFYHIIWQSPPKFEMCRIYMLILILMVSNE